MIARLGRHNFHGLDSNTSLLIKQYIFREFAQIRVGGDRGNSTTTVNKNVPISAETRGSIPRAFPAGRIPHDNSGGDDDECAGVCGVADRL